MNMRRLFAGVPVAAGAALCAGIRRLQSELAAEKIRWTRLENLHLTVEFFGATADEKRPELELALGRAAAMVGPFPLRLAGAGTFGGRFPRVLWLGVHSPGLEELHRQVAAQLRAAGWTPEARPFSPHLTIGRLDRLREAAQLAALVEKNREKVWDEQRITELILYESIEGRYQPLQRWGLGAP